MGRIVTAVSDSTIQISLKAQGYKLFVLSYFENPKPITIDLSKSVSPKNSAEEVSYDQPLVAVVRKYSAALGFSNEVHSIHPEQINIKINKLYHKTIPVKVLSDLSFAPQYLQFEPLQINPSSVMVFGTKDAVDSIKAVNTTLLRIHNINVSETRLVELIVGTSYRKMFFVPSHILVGIPVQKFTEASIAVSILLDEQFENQKISTYPDKAVVSCIVPMKDYTKLEPRMFTVTASATGRDNLLHLKVTTSPSFVKNIKVTPEKVEYLVIQ
jgi:YbbR domain-containing protein